MQEILDLGLHGWAMSRFSGCWVGFKSDRRDRRSSARRSIVDPDRVEIVLPDDFALPPGGLNIRWPDAPLDQEARMQDYKMLRRARLLRAPTGSTASSSTARTPRLGIITTGKSYLDVRQALDDLGIDEADAARDRHPPVQGRR